MSSKQNELGKALILAEHILDRPNADPDDDLGVLALHLTRTVESAARILGWWITSARHPQDEAMLLAQRDKFHKWLTAAIDPEGAAEGRYG